MELTFRALITFNIVIATIFWAAPYYDYLWLSNPEMALLDQGGLGAIFKTGEIYYWSTFLIWLLLSLGLFFYIKVAKPAFITFYLISLIMAPFLGIQVLTGYEVLLSTLVALSDGAIIAFLLFTSIGSKFVKSS